MKKPSNKKIEDELEIVLNAIGCVLKTEEEIDVKVESKRSIQQVVELSQSAEKKAILQTFCLELVAVINKTLKHFGRVREHTAKERAQTLFFTSSQQELPGVWKHGCAQLGISVVSVHQQQSVNRVLFEKVLARSLSHCEDNSSKLTRKREDLSCDECNAVRYAAGYTTKKLLEVYKKVNSCTAANFVECLSQMKMVGHRHGSIEDCSFYDFSMEWMANIDRGGLFYVDDKSFMLFKAIEIKTQELLPQHLRTQQTSSKELIAEVVADDDVQFWWSMISIDIDLEIEQSQLLEEIIEKWITMRGFSMVSSWLEQYKLAKQKNVKRSKSLRKDLSTD